MNSKSVAIVPFVEYDNVMFYTIIFEGEELSETSKFKSKYRAGDFKDEYQALLLAMWLIGDRKADKVHFRPCATKADNIMALPAKEDETKGCVLRLYCIVLTDNIVILGNGGEKRTRFYNDDPFLNDCVNVLLAIDTHIKEKKYTFKEKELIGELKFKISWP